MTAAQHTSIHTGVHFLGRLAGVAAVTFMPLVVFAAFMLSAMYLAAGVGLLL